MLRLLISVFVLLFGNSGLYATTYYVSWSFGSDSNDGHTGCPAETSACHAWKSLDKIDATTFSAGDTVIFRKGETWDLTNASNQTSYGGINILGWRIRQSGTNGNPITFKSMAGFGSGNIPIFDCGSPGVGTTCTVIYGVVINYITIDSLQFQNLGTNDNSFDNAVLIEGANSPNLGDGSNSWEIKNCVVSYTNQAFQFQGNGHWIHNNTISHITHSGIYSFGTSIAAGANNVVESNEVSFCDYNGIDVVGATNRNITVKGNYVHDNNDGIELSGTSYSLVYNNVCYNNHATDGPYSNSLGCVILVNQASYNLIYSNTSYMCDYGYVLQNSTTNLHNEFKNNISAESTVAEMFIFNETQRVGNTFDSNLYFTTGGTSVRFTEDGGLGGGQQTTTWWTSNVDAHGIYTSPAFANASSRPLGLALLSSSPAINSGLSLGSSYSTDYLGISRPQGSGWDRGAFEYTSSACDINEDGLVNSSDISSLLNIILGRTSSSKGDLNTDGKKNILDLMILISVILGRIGCPI